MFSKSNLATNDPGENIQREHPERTSRENIQREHPERTSLHKYKLWDFRCMAVAWLLHGYYMAIVVVVLAIGKVH
jgi:hypothetical protein